MSAEPLPSNRATGAFERRVARSLDALAPHDAPLLVACSGGPDSTAALVAVARARGPDGPPLVAACFDHGLRPPREAALDRAAVEAVAARLGRAVLSGSASDIESGPASGAGGPEAAARDARYRWLAQACAQAGVAHCVTGHTLDDQAETVLLRLTRGTGTLGAAGMAATSPWPVPCEEGPLRVLRPLLGLRREQASAYLEALGLEARLDPTNELLNLDRNRVRRRVLPELRALNPRVEEALARFAALARSDEEELSAAAEREAERLLLVRGDTAVLRRRPLLALPDAIASRLLRRAAAAVGVDVDGGQVRQLLRISGRRGARLSLAGGEAEVVGDELRIVATGRGGERDRRARWT